MNIWMLMLMVALGSVAIHGLTLAIMGKKADALPGGAISFALVCGLSQGPSIDASGVLIGLAVMAAAVAGHLGGVAIWRRLAMKKEA
jgi:hypothetical protein